jgi:hypothetical protein
MDKRPHITWRRGWADSLSPAPPAFGVEVVMTRAEAEKYVRTETDGMVVEEGIAPADLELFEPKGHDPYNHEGKNARPVYHHEHRWEFLWTTRYEK